MSQLSSDDRHILLARARQAILEAVVHQRIPDFDKPMGRLAEPRGAFVSIYLRRRLHGCIGRIDKSTALAETVVQCAISAALYDPRSTPLDKHRAGEVEIEVSVISELRSISADGIEVGSHGLLVKRGEKRGLLLPQVATRRKWSADRFLEETCLKAGLDSKAWGDPQTQLLGFTVEVFSEADFRDGYSSST